MADRPNVVMIVADTFRRDHLGAYGNGRIHTPHLDEFVRSSDPLCRFRDPAGGAVRR